MAKNIDIQVRSKCPYCGFQNQHVIRSGVYYRFTTLCCDQEVGGCDEYYTIHHRLEVDYNVYEMKRESDNG